MTGWTLPSIGEIATWLGDDWYAMQPGTRRVLVGLIRDTNSAEWQAAYTEALWRCEGVLAS